MKAHYAEIGIVNMLRQSNYKDGSVKYRVSQKFLPLV